MRMTGKTDRRRRNVSVCVNKPAQNSVWENRARIMLLFLYFMLSRRKTSKQVQLKLTKYRCMFTKMKASPEKTQKLRRNEKFEQNCVFERNRC